MFHDLLKILQDEIGAVITGKFELAVVQDSNPITSVLTLGDGSTHTLSQSAFDAVRAWVIKYTPKDSLVTKITCDKDGLLNYEAALGLMPEAA
jgi:hypothetical protein